MSKLDYLIFNQEILKGDEETGLEITFDKNKKKVYFKNNQQNAQQEIDKNKQEKILNFDSFFKTINSTYIHNNGDYLFNNNTNIILNKNNIDSLSKLDDTSDLNKPITVLENVEFLNKQNVLVVNDNIKSFFERNILLKNINLKQGDFFLDNVNNTSDAQKPLSLILYSELEKKQPKLFSGLNLKRLNNLNLLIESNEYNLLLLYKYHFSDLKDLNNTSDLNKVISNNLNAELIKKHTKLISRQNIKTIFDYNVLGAGDLVFTAGNFLLNNCNDTSDINKPISIPLQVQLDKKQDRVGFYLKTFFDTTLLITDTIKDIPISKELLLLRNIDNTSDANKPISNILQTELDKLENTSTFSIKSLFGLNLLANGNIDLTNLNFLDLNNLNNTDDLSKLISVAFQTELNNKQNTLISGTNFKTINSNHLLGSTGNISFTAVDFFLNNLNNTFDINKPCSTALYIELEKKQDILINGTNIKTFNSISLIGSGDNIIPNCNDLMNVDNTSDLNKPISNIFNNELNNKQDTTTFNIKSVSNRILIGTGEVLYNYSPNDLNLVNNTQDNDKIVSNSLKLELEKKIDKRELNLRKIINVTGKEFDILGSGNLEFLAYLIAGDFILYPTIFTNKIIDNISNTLQKFSPSYIWSGGFFRYNNYMDLPVIQSNYITYPYPNNCFINMPNNFSGKLDIAFSFDLDFIANYSGQFSYTVSLEVNTMRRIILKFNNNYWSNIRFIRSYSWNGTTYIPRNEMVSLRIYLNATQNEQFEVKNIKLNITLSKINENLDKYLFCGGESVSTTNTAYSKVFTKYGRRFTDASVSVNYFQMPNLVDNNINGQFFYSAYKG